MTRFFLLIFNNKCAYAHIYSSLLHADYLQAKFSMLLSKGSMLNFEKVSIWMYTFSN